MILFSYGSDEPSLCLYIAYKEPRSRYYRVMFYSDWWCDWVISSYFFNKRHTNKKKLRQFLLGHDNIEIYHFS